jgi:hypothetical protein
LELLESSVESSGEDPTIRGMSADPRMWSQQPPPNTAVAEEDAVLEDAVLEDAVLADVVLEEDALFERRALRTTPSVSPFDTERTRRTAVPEPFLEALRHERDSVRLRVAARLLRAQR